MKKIIVISILLLACFLAFAAWQYVIFKDGKLHVVFCDVGQGDAIFIKTPSGADILVDGGPSDAVLSCLEKYMPFWDRTIEVMILSHPHQDHLKGLISVLQRYTVLSFATENITNKTSGFATIQQLLTENHIPKRTLQAGDRFSIADGVVLEILAPTQAFLDKTSPHGKIGETGEFGSLIDLVWYGSFRVLLTGDSQVEELQQAITSANVSNLSVLQVPHHGSAAGLSRTVLETLSPKVAVISVGARNKYGHPTKKTLDLLSENKIQVMRTDEDGEVEIVSDGSSFSIK